MVLTCANGELDCVRTGPMRPCIVRGPQGSRSFDKTHIVFANTVRAIVAVPLVTTFVVGAMVLTAMGWWLLSVLVLDGAPNPRNRPMAKSKAETVDVDSLDFAQPASTRGRSGQAPEICSARRYKDTLKVKIGDKALAGLGISLGTRTAPVKVRVEGALNGNVLYVRQCDAGGWSLGKHHNATKPPNFGEVAFTGPLAQAVFEACGEALGSASTEVTWTLANGGKMLVITLPTGE